LRKKAQGLVTQQTASLHGSQTVEEEFKLLRLILNPIFISEPLPKRLQAKPFRHK